MLVVPGTGVVLYSASIGAIPRELYEAAEVEGANGFQKWLRITIPLLKPTATVYVCADWRSSPVIYSVLRDYLIVRNRITWEREKGRGALTNSNRVSKSLYSCPGFLRNKYSDY